MNIILAADHAGFSLKEEIRHYLERKKYAVEDLGTHRMNHADDYPDFILPAARKVAEDPEHYRGIVFGGSGQGEAIAANKVVGIRCALYYGGDMEMVRLSRRHNDANMLSLGARFVSREKAKEAVDLWLSTPFEGGRHENRLRKVSDFESQSGM